MKYEMIFGDAGLFDGAGTFTGLDVVVHSIASGIKSYARLSDLTPESLRNHPVCAMRRIIKEPKRWTWEDKKAGVLPEVGIKCVWVNLSGTETPDDLLYPEVGEEIEIVANTKTYDGKYPVSVFKWLHDDGETQCYAASGHVEDFKPIETPEEREQREEDEFVVAMLDAASQEQLMSAGFKSGVIAAYRKLKGGE